ncbi:MAG: hypothetical protein A3F17_07975 [Gammaproteobacteria bacterium RIFCSPHIGHO2_12_FULL_41_15]|nr:MAG: hypothetical protein A3F17_07975 [Gammaproteobacteria bacterium RIFCSPHIGHO2_12_FULL_41_15]
MEELPHQPLSKANVPDIDIYFFRYGIYFDDIQKTTTISKLVYGSTEADYQQALTDMESILEMIQQPFPEKTMSKEHAKKSIQVDLNDIAFEKMVVKAKEYIQQGEVFQMVLSRTFQKEFNQNSFHLYEKLKKENPSLYHFYFKTDHYHLVGASPEKIVSNQKGIITSTPLAGSRSLHDNDPKTTIQNLLADEKERAEHLMLVDLARNDLGRIAVPGSVYVEKLTYPLILKNIVHIASDVKAQLDSLFDVVDVLTTSFPAGTLSGAPKVRAMQLIDELESSDRGFYGGCILAIDHADNMDTCIIIRSALIQDNTIYIRSGCGIVYDSTPLKEVEETRHKAKSMLEAIATL